jgi:hypothetical protein
MTWQTAKDSVVGTSHAKTGKPCQDAHFVCITADMLAIAVSDGMGSATYSDVGSSIAARVVVDSMKPVHKQTSPIRSWMANIFDAVLKFFRTSHETPRTEQEVIQQRMATAFEKARSSVLEHAANHQHSPRDYACTLLLLVVTKGAWYTMHVGDGAIVGYLTPETTMTLSEPENGEYVNTTTPITSSQYMEQMRFGTGNEPLIGVAVLTDGIQQLCINQKTRRSFDPFFAYVLKTFRVPQSDSDRDRLVRDFLCSQPVQDKCDDDLTLVVAWRAIAEETDNRGATRT